MPGGHRRFPVAVPAVQGARRDFRVSPLHPEYLYYAFKKLTKAADPPPIRLHDLRHTAPACPWKPAPT